ncbi:PLAC8 motif-containing protein [Trema orientale]|uniref:PLAC8 motif-containing protein n=1 Tax=Trema orientale TaxID=63057 RepID=A0A2P5ELN8_TREOI|nr:PLAC8 motif-containing protein [Trema orientale]
MEDHSLNEVDQTHIHIEVETNGGIEVDYSNASDYDQQNYHEDHDQYSQPQPPNTAENGPPDQQQPAQPPEYYPQPSPAPPQPVQPQANYHHTRPAVAVHQFPPPEGPQINFMFQNEPNQPRPFTPQSPQPQHLHAHMTQPVQFSPAQYQHTNPMYPNGAHQPQGYPQSPLMKSVHPPPAQINMGPPGGASPQPAYQTAPSPVKFPPQNGGAPGPGAAPGSYPNGLNGPAQGFPMQNQFQAPPVMMVQQVGTGAWNTGLFDCMDDPMNAVVTAFCPCITFGQVAEIVDNGTTSCATSGLLYGLVAFLIGLPCIMSCTYRTKLRSRFGLVETPAPDWVTHFLCECCAICQEYRELQSRGLDPSIGWQGNVARIQQQQVNNMMPPMNQRMMP